MTRPDWGWAPPTPVRPGHGYATVNKSTICPQQIECLQLQDKLYNESLTNPQQFELFDNLQKSTTSLQI